MKIAIAGGDARMLTVARLLEASGNECIKIALGGQNFETDNALKDTAAVVLPLPCEKGGILNAPMSNEAVNIGDIFAAGGADTLFIGGKLPARGENFIDYSTRDDFRLYNAVPTAEGAIAIAMQELKTTLNGANALVLGYGRIGNYLSQALKGLNALVTVAARRPESRALAEISGITAISFDELASALPKADIVFNTVPHTVLGINELTLLKKETAVIDLASANGGTDKASAAECGIKIIHALALPGKVAPESAGRIIYETVVTVLRERGLGI